MRRAKTAYARGHSKWSRMGAAWRKKGRMEDFMMREIHRATIAEQIERAMRKKGGSI